MKILTIVLIVAGLLVCFGASAYTGYKYYEKKHPASETAAQTTESETAAETEVATETTTADQELETCLKAKWGEDKYTAVMANPSLASADDKFNALPCYK